MDPRIAAAALMLATAGAAALPQPPDPKPPAKAAPEPVVLFADPLDGGAKGKADDGKFVTGGGWQATGKHDRVTIELPVAARDGGAFEMDVRNLDLPRMADEGENYILGLREHLDLSGGGANVPNADYFTMYAGTKYPQFKLKYHTHGFSRQEDTYAPVQAFDPARTYRLRVEWAARRLAVSLDGKVFYEQTSPESDPFDRVKYVQLGDPRPPKADLKFGTLRGPVYSNLRVTVPSAADPRAPLDLTAPTQKRAVTLAWQAPAKPAGLRHYLVLRDSAELAVVGAGTTRYEDAPPAEGRYAYTVAAVYDSGERAYAPEPVFAAAVEPRAEAGRAGGPVKVDGKLDEPGWKPTTRLSKALRGRGHDDVTFGALWDDTHLYLGVRVLDKSLVRDSAGPTDDDALEVVIDGDNNGRAGAWAARVFDDHDRQLIVRWNDPGLFLRTGGGPLKYLPGGGAADGVAHAVAPVPGGYAVEVAVSWKSLGVDPKAAADLGLDVRQHDDDDGGAADARLGWVSESESPVFTLAYGDLTLRK